MKAEQMKGLDTGELVTKAHEMQEQMFRLRFQMSLGQNEGLKKLRELKKDRARALTLLRQRQLAGETIPAAPPAPALQLKKGKK